MVFRLQKLIICFIVLLANYSLSAQSSNDYTYSRKEKKFQIFNSEGREISKELVFVSNFNTLFEYFYDTKTKTLLKLSYFDASQNDISVAEKVLIGKDPNFIYFDKYGASYLYCEGREISNNEVKISTPNGKLFVMSPNTSGYTYTFVYEEGKEGIVPLKRLPMNNINAYWTKTLRRGDVTKTDIGIFFNGDTAKKLDDSKFVSGNFLFVIGNKYFKANNYKSSKLYKFNELIEITKSEYGEQVSRKVVPKVVSSNSNSIGTCNSDTSCLLALSEKKYNSVINKGGTKDKAYDAMTKVFIEAYKSKPRDAYEMVMNMKSDNLAEVIKRMPKDVRSAIRAMSMQTVSEYEKKYGSPKIKTVPYKPKKGN